jgi:hypothetical protein
LSLVCHTYVHPPPLNGDVYNVKPTNKQDKIWYHQMFNVHCGGLEDEDPHVIEMMNNIMGIFVRQMQHHLETKNN